MSLIDRCADEIRAVLRTRHGTVLSHSEAVEVTKQVFEGAIDPPEDVLLAMCELECNRQDCRKAHTCQGHHLGHHKQRWEVAINAVLAQAR